jgi:hypothetical protein
MFLFPLCESAQLCSGHGQNDFRGVGCQQLLELAHQEVSLTSPIMIIKWLERPVAFMTSWIYKIMIHYSSFSEFRYWMTSELELKLLPTLPECMPQTTSTRSKPVF